MLFVVFDDLNTNTGFFGDRAAKTPHLDRFAQRATSFTNAHCAIAVCNPSRAALLTGQPPWVAYGANNRTDYASAARKR